MHLYSLFVNIVDAKGLVLTQVPRKNVSAPEVIVLRHRHGPSRIVDIKESGKLRRWSPREIRDLLDETYTPAAVTAALGQRHVPLPTEIRLGDDTMIDDDLPDEIVEADPDDPLTKAA